MIGMNEATHPHLGYHYKINKLCNHIQQYIVRADGEIISQNPANVALTKKPCSIVISKNGYFAYIFHDDAMVSVFSINQLTGLLNASYPAIVPFAILVNEIEELLKIK